MRTLRCLLALLGLPNALRAADPFVGTWKLNVRKSQPPPAPAGMVVREETVVIQETNERYEVTVKGTQENGSAISVGYSHPLKGGPVTYSDLPGGTSEAVAVKRTNDSTLDFIRRRDGKVVSTNHVTVSAN